MANYDHYHGTAVDVRQSPVERVLHWAIAKFTAWAGPKLRKAGKFLFAEFVRGAIALSFLGFALAAGIYGAFYLLDFLVDVIDNWVPHWAALGIISAVLLVPAGIAALIGLWQVSKMRTVRTGVAVVVQFGALVWALARGKNRESSPF